MPLGRGRALEFIVATVLSLTPVISLLSPAALAPLILVAALAILAFGPRREILRLAPHWFAIMLVLLATLGLASTAWAIAPKHSILKGLQLLPLFAAAYVLLGAARTLPDEARRRAGRGLVIGVVVAVLIILLEVLVGGLLHHLLTGMPLRADESLARYKRGMVVVALFATPAVYWAWHHGDRRVASLIVVGVAVSAVLLQSGTVVAAIGIGIVWALLTAWAPRFGRRSLMVTLVLLFVGIPLIRFGPAEVPADILHKIRSGGMYRLNSAVHRYVIWHFVAEKIAERPVLGWGLDSSRAIPGGQAGEQGYSERLPLHPHNAALQLWLELGLLGGLLGACIAVWPVTRIGHTIWPGPAEAAAVGLVAATAVVALLGFGIWQSWWVAAIGLVAMCAVAVFPPRMDSG